MTLPGGRGIFFTLFYCAPLPVFEEGAFFAMETFRKVFVFIRPFRRRLLTAVALTGAMTLLGMVPPVLMRYIIDDVVGLGRWNMAPAILMAAS